MSENYNLKRYLNAQEEYFPMSIMDITRGRKESNWIWFIFPQLQGLGYSATTKYYELQGLDEAQTYLQHPILGSRLLKLCRELYNLKGDDPELIFSRPDDKKLHASITLFSSLPETDPIFQRILEKFFKGKKEKRTQRILDKICNTTKVDPEYPDSSPVFIY